MTTTPHTRDALTHGGTGYRETGDLAKRQSNMMRPAIVVEVDPERGKARCELLWGEITTGWLPWLTLRGRADRHWWAPEVDDVVLLFAPSGNLSTAFIWPGMFSDENWNGNRLGLRRTTYKDGSTEQYDRNDPDGPGIHATYITGSNGEGQWHLVVDGPVSIDARDGVHCGVIHCDEIRATRVESQEVNADTVATNNPQMPLPIGGGGSGTPREFPPLPPDFTDGVRENKAPLREQERQRREAG